MTVAMPWLESLKAASDVAALRDALNQRWPAFAKENLNSLAIVGAADEGVRLAGLCREHGIEIAAICDDNPAKQGTNVAGFNGRVTIDRLAHGVGSGKFYDMGVVGKDVDVFVSLELLSN